MVADIERRKDRRRLAFSLSDQDDGRDLILLADAANRSASPS
jgi:hypothetical protein